MYTPLTRDVVTELLPEAIHDHIWDNVRPMYTMLDRCHDRNHFDEVWHSMMHHIIDSEYAQKHITTKEKMELLIAAAYHDVGRLMYPLNKPMHHGEASAIMMKNDQKLRRLILSKLNPGSRPNVDRIATIISNHGGSSGKVVTDELSLMLKDADKEALVDPNRTYRRWIYYYLDHHTFPVTVDTSDELADLIYKDTKGNDYGFKPRSKAYKEMNTESTFFLNRHELHHMILKMWVAGDI